MTEIITSAQNAKIKKIFSLQQKKKRAEEGLFFVQGARTVSEGLDSRIYEADTVVFAANALQNEKNLQAIEVKARAEKAAVILVEDKLMPKLTGRENAQPVVGTFRQKFLPLDDAVRGDFILALDRVRDPGNLGTIMRTMDALALPHLVLIGDCCDAFSPESVDAATGSVFNVHVTKCGEADFIKAAVKSSHQIVATALDSAQDYRKIKYGKPLALLMGSEQSGLSPALRESATHTAKLPMPGKAESLNLSVATGIMLYAIHA